VIPSAVLVAAVALQTKFALSSKFSRNVGSIPKLTCFVDLGKAYNQVPREKLWRGYGSTALTGASCWPSSNCIPVQKIVSMSTKSNHNHSALVLDSSDGVSCHHSFSSSISGSGVPRVSRARGQSQFGHPYPARSLAA